MTAEKLNKMEETEKIVIKHRTQAAQTLAKALAHATRLRYFYETIAILLEDKYEDKDITKAIITAIKKELPQYKDTWMDLRRANLLGFELKVGADWTFEINLSNQQKFSIKRFLSDNDWAGTRNIANIHRYTNILDVIELPVTVDETDTIYGFLSHWYFQLLPMYEVFLKLYDKMEGVQFIIPEEIKKSVDEFIKIRHKVSPNS